MRPTEDIVLADLRTLDELAPALEGKVFGEALARYYVEEHGLAIICLRIGAFLPRPTDEVTRWMWLSPRDCTQVIWRAIESPVRYGVFYAISNNRRRHWDITDTMELLGYQPEDDAEDYPADRAAA
ncbi:MAG: NAD(P)-dependent oxidoreductase [Chloroflexi bacterium]|nr:NAD(P)-dependent oxidoreductase [Chloroflexota bacterium]